MSTIDIEQNYSFKSIICTSLEEYIFNNHSPLGTEIWIFDCKAFNATYFYDQLSKSEQNKAKNFKRASVRHTYIASRVLLRKLLSIYLKTPSEKIDFKYSSYGKPYVEKCEFNLSHSQSLIAIAINFEHSLGVDIQSVNPIFSINHMAQMVYSSEEISWIENSKDEYEKRDKFYNLWTRKEALLKAFGTGFIDNPLCYSVLNTNDSFYFYKDSEWSIESFNPNQNYAGAIAINNRSPMPSKIFRILILNDIAV